MGKAAVYGLGKGRATLARKHNHHKHTQPTTYSISQFVSMQANTSSVVSPTPTPTPDWSALSTGVSGSIVLINAVAIDSSNNVYVGGEFTYAGTTVANNIAKWNGSTWSSLGTGSNNGTNGQGVNSIAIDSNNNVYVGGVFTAAGTTPVNNIAKWDGSSWSSLGSGVTAGFGWSVLSVAINANNDVYVGGTFITAGTTAANNIAKWNGSSWSSLGTGPNNGTDNTVWSISIDSNNHVYVGGVFSNAGTTPANYIAKWDGSIWSSLGTGSNNGTNDMVNSIAIDSNNNVYVGGVFSNAGTTLVNNIAKWDGSIWSSLGGGMTGNILGILQVKSISIDSNNKVYAGGTFRTAGTTAANNIAKWDGTSWYPLSSGANNFVLDIAIQSNNNVYVGGCFSTAGGKSANCIAKWGV